MSHAPCTRSVYCSEERKRESAEREERGREERGERRGHAITKTQTPIHGSKRYVNLRKANVVSCTLHTRSVYCSEEIRERERGREGERADCVGLACQ